jgi:SAM-dependent methyltransferase
MEFSGDVVDHYARFRRGYPQPALMFVVDRLQVGPDDLVVDLGCGTGQLALPLAGRVRHVLGIDPAPDMLARAAAQRDGVRAVSWMLGSDADVASLPDLLGSALSPRSPSATLSTS